MKNRIELTFLCRCGGRSFSRHLHGDKCKTCNMSLRTNVCCNAPYPLSGEKMCRIIQTETTQQSTDIFFQTIVRLTNSHWLLSKSVSGYLQSLKLGPNNAIMHMNLAIIYREQGLIDLAIDTLRIAIKLQPKLCDAYYHLANALNIKGRIREAEEFYNKVLDLCPTHKSSQNNLANLKYKQGYKDDATKLYLKILKIFPDYVSAHYNLAAIFHEEGKYLEALKYYEEVIRIQPTIENVYFNMGNIFNNIRNVNKALEYYLIGLRINPNHAEAHNNLGCIYKRFQYIPQAINSYKTALKLKPDFYDAHCNLLLCKIMICDWTDYELLTNKLPDIVVDQLEKNRLPHVCPFFSIVYPLSHSLRKAIAVKNAEWDMEKLKIFHKLSFKLINDIAPGNRLRIGYVSSDFIDRHPMPQCMQSIPGLHNKSQVEIFVYAISPDDGSVCRSKISKESEHFIDLSHIPSDLEAAEKIHSDGIHILVNMNGYTGAERNVIFALRPSPIQVMWIGFPGTSGASYIDYIITDMVTSPVEFASQYTEKFAYMPQTYFIGDHRQMFPHLCDRIILINKMNCNDNMSENVAIINGIDLSPIIENTNIKEIKHIIKSKRANSNMDRPVEVIQKIAELDNFTNIENMISSGHIEISINGAIVTNGLLITSTDTKEENGKAVMQKIVITTRQQYGLPENAVIYCCFNKLFKISPDLFHMWVNILKAVPNSILWLLRFPKEGEHNIIKTALNLGIAPGRIIFTDNAVKEEHMRRGQLADVGLDTLLYNGHTTSMDMLWSGIPLVTLPGESFASRVAASILAALGCPELIAKTSREYQDIAIKLGTDKEYLRRIKAKVWWARLESSLFNCSIYTNDLERLYRAMWDKYQRGEKPDHILSLENY